MDKTFFAILTFTLATLVYSQKVYYNQCTNGDSLRFRFDFPHFMTLKIYRENQLRKVYNFKGTKDLEMITDLHNIRIYSNSKEMRFYILKPNQHFKIPKEMQQINPIIF